MKTLSKSFVAYGAALLLLLLLLIPLSFIRAAALVNLSDTMSRLAASTLSDHTICFQTPTGVGAGQTVQVTFPAGFNMGTFSVNNVDFASGTSCTSATDATLSSSQSGSTWGVAQSSQTITFTSDTGTVTAGDFIVIEIGANATNQAAGTTQITNPGTTGSYPITIGGSFADSGTITVVIISDDQVQITATVDQILSFSISDNTIGFGSLDISNARYATGNGVGSATPTTAHDLQAATNASSGYSITMDGATLTSGLNTITEIGGTATGSSIGNEQFGVRFSASGGAGTASSPYDGASDFAFDSASFPDEVASSTGPSANTTYNAIYLANISPTTEPGTYTTTLTYIATANF